MEKSVLFFFAILAACASIGSTLQCFECIPLNPSESCQDPFKANNAHTKSCRPEEVCFKQIGPTISSADQDAHAMIIRGCGSKSFCRNEPTQLQEFCHICSEDLCNSVVQVIPSLSTFIVLYIIKLFFL